MGTQGRMPDGAELSRVGREAALLPGLQDTEQHGGASRRAHQEDERGSKAVAARGCRALLSVLSTQSAFPVPALARDVTPF